MDNINFTHDSHVQTRMPVPWNGRMDRSARPLGVCHSLQSSVAEIPIPENAHQWLHCNVWSLHRPWTSLPEWTPGDLFKSKELHENFDHCKIQIKTKSSILLTILKYLNTVDSYFVHIILFFLWFCINIHENINETALNSCCNSNCSFQLSEKYKQDFKTHRGCFLQFYTDISSSCLI